MYLEQAQSLTARGVDCVVVASSESRKGFRYVIPKYLRLIRDALLAVLKDNFDIIHAHYIFPTAIRACLQTHKSFGIMRRHEQRRLDE